MKDIIILESGVKVVYCDKIKGYRKLTTFQSKAVELFNKLEQKNKDSVKFYTMK